MFQSLMKLCSLLSQRARRQAVLLLAIMLLLGVVEVAGVASVFPMLLGFGSPDTIQQNAYLKGAYDLMRFQSANGFLIFLALTMFVLTVLRIALSVLMTYASTRFPRTLSRPARARPGRGDQRSRQHHRSSPAEGTARRLAAQDHHHGVPLHGLGA